jgi:hypothetical protein
MSRRRDWVYFESAQPTRAAWKALQAFAEEWNGTHESQWAKDLFDLNLQLPRGLEDAEHAALEAGLAKLKRKHRIVGLEAIPAPDSPEETLERAYISLVGEGPPQGLVVNELEAFGPPLPCPLCGRVKRERDAPLVGSLELDEGMLERGPGGSSDLFNLANDGRLITRRFADALRDAGAAGYRLVPVRSALTGATSERLFVLAATHAVLGSCEEHAGRDHVSTCAGCGVVDGRLDSFHAPERETRGLSVLSRHRFGLADLYFARETLRHLLSSGLRGLSASTAFDVCNAAAPTPRVRPAEQPDVARFVEPPDAEGLRAFLAHLEDPSPRFECSASSGRGPDRTFDVAHLVEPGCSAEVFDAMERDVPEAKALRGLYTRANGLLLYCQVPPKTYPTRQALRRGEGEVEDPSFLRFEKAEAWRALRKEMLAYAADLEEPFVAADGVPFAQLTASADLLVCWHGAVYYFSPLANRFHNQRLARSVGGFLARVAHDPAAFLLDTASVARFHGPRGKQYVPRTYRGD